MHSLASKFQALFGVEPEIVASAPGRVNLIGEHVDFLDGFVLPFAISDVTTVAIARNSTGVIRSASLQKEGVINTVDVARLSPKSGEAWTRYPIGVLWSLEINCGLDILIDGQVPLGAGLSSSAALECAMATAINELFDLKLSLSQLARAAQRAENIYVGMPCGIMDQSVSLLATQGNALLLDTRDLSTEQIPFDIAPLGLELLVIDTQVHHALVDGGYAERRASCEKAVADLGIASLRDISVAEFVSRKSELDEKTYIRAFHGVTEMQRVLDAVALLKAGDFVGFGEIVTAAHISLRDNYTVSCPELNLAADTANKFGALGARMIGGGFGGSAIALIKAKDSELIKSEISSAFMASKFKSPRFFSALPSSGASVIN
ncbi:MAG: galactokinase [Actinomycetales bacterium]|nr:MAG: galactokinase [Actinomycetales bacterium]